MTSDSAATSSARSSAIVEHRLQRLQTLRRVRSGALSRGRVQDASPELVSSAEVLGVPQAAPCPLCGRRTLREVLWIHGEVLGEKSGTARSVREVRSVIAELKSRLASACPDTTVNDSESAEISIHTVEVCTRCRWNCLLQEETFGLGERPHPSG